MSDIWTPSPRMLETTVLPRSASRDSQVELISALGAIFQDVRASNREVVNCIKDLTASLGAESMYSASPARATQARAQRKGISGTNTAEEQLGGIPRGVVPGAVPGGTNTAEVQLRAAHRGGPTGADVRSQALGALSAHAHDLHVGSYKEGKQAGWGGAKNVIYNRSAQALSSMKLGGDYYEQVEVPEDYDVQPGQTMDRSFINFEEGQATKQVYRNQMTGEVADSNTAAAALKRVSVANSIRRGAAAMGEGGSLRAGVAAAMPKMAASAGAVAGGIGIGVTVAQQAYQQVLSQQAANRPFQEVLGGGNRGGYEERLRQNAFRVGNMFSSNPLSGGQSEEIYKGAMELYAGDRGMRNEAQDVMVDVLKRTGMSPTESLAVLRTAAQEGNTAIQNIGQALKDVTTNAREAGMNAKEARDRFAETFKTVSQSFTGAEAVAYASGQTQMQTDLGHRYQNVNFDTTSQQQQMMVGAENGMTQAEVMQRMQQPGGASWFSGEQNKIAQRNVAGYISSIGGDEVIARYTDNGRKKELNSQERKEMENELLGLTGSPEAAASTIAALTSTSNVSPDQVGGILAGYATGQTDSTDDIKEQASAYNQVDVGKMSRSEKVKLITGLGIRQSDAIDIVDGKSGKHHTRKTGAAQKYLAWVESSGKTSPILEKLIRDYDGSRRYRVNTAGGETNVGTYELIESFADQANQGNVEISKGSGSGGTIAEMLTISANELNTAGQAATSADAEYTGTNFNDEVEKSEGGHSTLHIEMGPELRKYFNISATDGTQIDYSSGTTPTGTPTAANMPTGGGH